jgi:hypothetical protein
MLFCIEDVSINSDNTDNINNSNNSIGKFTTIVQPNYRRITTSGLDERYGNTSEYDNETQRGVLNKIKINIAKKRLLDVLEDNKTAVNHKLKLIEEHFDSNSVKSHNLNAGGLFRDFENMS